MRSSTLPLDLNPILDDGALTSTSGIENATALCDALCIPLDLDPPRAHYFHGWGDTAENAKPFIATWTLVINDIHGRPTSLQFDIVEGTSPMILGLDVRKYCNTMNRTNPPTVCMKRPMDVQERVFFTYIAADDDTNERLRVDLVPHRESTMTSLLGTTKHGLRIDKNAIKKIHRFTHASADEMKSILKDADKLSPELSDACDMICNACDICASTGRPAHRKKVSISHVNEAFNQSMQADFLVVYVSQDKYEVLNMIDAGTNYGERVIVQKRDAQEMAAKLETEWIYHHGAPRTFSADPEFTRPALRKILKSHGIDIQERPSCSSSKNGKVERNNGLFKQIFDRISHEQTTASPQTLVARASFLCNIFHGSSILSSFQLARGYSPSLLGIPHSHVPPDLLNAHKSMTDTRALQKLMRSHDNHLVPFSALKSGSQIWVYYNTSKQNDPVRWVRATVVSTTPFYVRCRRSDRGPPMQVAYEHIRMVPEGELANELQQGILEDLLADDIPSSAHQEGVQHTGNNLEQEYPNDPAQIMMDVFGPEDDDEETTATDTLRKSFFTKAVLGEPEKDIGPTAHQQQIPVKFELQSDEQKVLQEIHKVTGGAQVSRKKMDCAPQWVLDKAVAEELDKAWKDAYVEVPEQTVPRNANIITSHIVYKVKREEKGHMRMKARLCPHGNRDMEKGNIRNDSSSAQFYVIRMMLSLVTLLKFRIGCIDVKGAYLQSGPITRDLYV